MTQRINHAQQLFLNTLVADMSVKNNKIVVTFANELFKHYKIVVLGNNSCLAEVTNGQNYYGSLNGNVFTPSKSVVHGHPYRVEVRHASGTYKIREMIAE